MPEIAPPASPAAPLSTPGASRRRGPGRVAKSQTQATGTLKRAADAPNAPARAPKRVKFETPDTFDTAPVPPLPLNPAEALAEFMREAKLACRDLKNAVQQMRKTEIDRDNSEATCKALQATLNRERALYHGAVPKPTAYADAATGTKADGVATALTTLQSDYDVLMNMYVQCDSEKLAAQAEVHALKAQVASLQKENTDLRDAGDFDLFIQYDP